MEIHLFEDRDLLILLQVVIRNGNLFGLVNQSSRFHDFGDIEKGISCLVHKGIIVRTHNEYEITNYGSIWRYSVWQKLGIRGIYRYLCPSGQAEGPTLKLDDPFLPKNFNYLKKG